MTRYGFFMVSLPSVGCVTSPSCQGQGKEDPHVSGSGEGLGLELQLRVLKPSEGICVGRVCRSPESGRDPSLTGLGRVYGVSFPYLVG